MTDFTGFTAETERMRLRTYTDEDFDAFLDLHRRDHLRCLHDRRKIGGIGRCEGRRDRRAGKQCNFQTAHDSIL